MVPPARGPRPTGHRPEFRGASAPPSLYGRPWSALVRVAGAKSACPGGMASASPTRGTRTLPRPPGDLLRHRLSTESPNPRSAASRATIVLHPAIARRYSWQARRHRSRRSRRQPVGPDRGVVLMSMTADCHPVIRRREALQVGALGLLGLGTNHLTALRAAGGEASPRARSVIYHLPLRGPRPARQLRHEARRPRRHPRRVRADRHGRPGSIRSASICRSSPRGRSSGRWSGR